MNCRQVERGVFPNNEIKKILQPNFVEARLHTDLPESHPHYKFNERIQAVRAKLLGEGNIGLPHYIIVDPYDLDKPLAHRAGSAGVAFFVKFFEQVEHRPGG